ncbi:MAG: BamA/TamA family outer membrane protein [Calditrichia bacterium]
MKNNIRHILIFLIAVAALQPLFGQQALTVETLEITGNSKTRESVIRNYLTIRENEPVTREQLAADEARLRSTNFFKEVQISIMPGSEKGLAKVTVTVSERKWPFFQFKSGFNELDGWYISPIGLRFDNILGRGNVFGWELVIGDRVAGARLAYVRPFLFGSEYDLGVQIFGYNREFLHFQPDERLRQQVRDAGFKLQISGNSGLAKYFSAAIVGQNVVPDTFLTRERNGDERFDVPAFLQQPVDTQKIGRFILAFTVDTRDQKIHPLSGWWGSAVLDQATKELGSFASFYRFTVDVRRYQPLWKKLTGAARIRWGTVSESAPFYEKFYLGGPNSLRGYADRSLTPPGYAAEIAQSSVELRFPLSRRLKYDRFTGVLFFDAGYAWNDPEAFDFSKFKSGIGWGLRLRLPIVGLLRTDFAYPLDGDDREMRVHVSLGHTF